MLERPQEAIFAEACRLLHLVSTTAGEGHIDRVALNRAAALNSQKALLLASEWFKKTTLLELFGGTSVRASYDCAPKRYRAQFLCLLYRLLLIETRQFGELSCRPAWTKILQNFPELALWQDFRERLQCHVWDNSSDPTPVEPRAYADEVTPSPEDEGPMDDATKAQKLLDTYWTLLSGPVFQTAYEKLRHRGKMTLQLGLMQLLEEATQEAVTQIGEKNFKLSRFMHCIVEVLGPNNVPGVEQRQGDGPRNFVSQLAQELPRQAKPKGGFADHLPSVRRTLPNSPWRMGPFFRSGLRTDIPLATWVDELNPCCLSSSASAVFMNPEVETGSIWTCQICSEPRISPTISLCPTCKRPRGTELRRSYLTASELTQSVVQAVNDDAGGVAGSVRSKGREKSPAKGASSAAVAARGPKRETRRVSFDGDQVQGRTFQASQKYGVADTQENRSQKQRQVEENRRNQAKSYKKHRLKSSAYGQLGAEMKQEALSTIPG
eukprot:g20823.t1